MSLIWPWFHHKSNFHVWFCIFLFCESHKFCVLLFHIETADHHHQGAIHFKLKTASWVEYTTGFFFALLFISSSSFYQQLREIFFFCVCLINYHHRTSESNHHENKRWNETFFCFVLSFFDICSDSSLIYCWYANKILNKTILNIRDEYCGEVKFSHDDEEEEGRYEIE